MSCNHNKEILDYQTGDVICLECGRAQAGCIFNDYIAKEIEQEFEEKASQILEEIKDILDRIHVPTSFAKIILAFHEQTFSGAKQAEIIFSIYKVLNDQGFKISSQELSAITSISKNVILGSQKYCEVAIDSTTMAEKYCVLLGLQFSTIEQIKAEIKSHQKSGHAPMTIIAGSIYKTCKKAKLKISIKKISQITNVSSISIQRYNKLFKN